MYRLVAVLATFLFSNFTSMSYASDAHSGKDPWPEIRKQRIEQLLPNALKNANVNAWLTICRENNNDPLADHVGCENAGSTAVFLFYLENNTFHSLAFSPSSESTALADLNVMHEVISVPRNQSSIDQVAVFIKTKGFKSIAINSSSQNAQADGLSYSQRKALENALGDDYSSRLVSSENVVYNWLSVKLPEEVAIMKEAARLTALWQIEAYQLVVPGKTTDAYVAAFLKEKMRLAGVKDAWAPDQNPNVNSGPDRGHSHATNKVIMPGDVIQIDFGIKLYDRWVSDIQRFAYVLKEGETVAPKDIQHYWDSAKAGGFAAFQAMRPGIKGIDVDAAQSVLMKKSGSEPVMWSTGHPVGYVAHDTGPNLGGSRSPTVRPSANKKLLEWYSRLTDFTVGNAKTERLKRFRWKKWLSSPKVVPNT
jgi:Xaa-Pro dipeptidase